MTTVAQMTRDWQAILGEEANELAHKVGFSQRKLTGSSFALSLVSGWLSDKDSTLASLSHAYSNSQRKAISRQGLNQRFTARAAHFLEWLLAVGLQKTLRRGQHPQSHAWFKHFSVVGVYDRTSIRLPEALAGLWRGTSGSSLKLQVGIDLKYGGMEHLSLHPGRVHDQQTVADPFPLPAGGLFIADLGFFKLSRFKHISQHNAFWLTRYKGGTQLLDAQGQVLDLVTCLANLHHLELPVRVGLKEQVACRLLAWRVSDPVYTQRLAALRDGERRHQTHASSTRHALCRWVIYLSNLPPHALSLAQVSIVYGLRWQIELLFKRWKSLFHLAHWRTGNPWRILCEVYAKMLAILFEHSLMALAGCHGLAFSRVQAHAVIAKHAWAVAAAFAYPATFRRTVSHLLFCLRAGWKISTSSSSPPTFQKMRTLN